MLTGPSPPPWMVTWMTEEPTSLPPWEYAHSIQSALTPQSPCGRCGLSMNPERPWRLDAGRDVHPAQIRLYMRFNLMTSHEALRPLPGTVDKQSQGHDNRGHHHGDDDSPQDAHTEDIVPPSDATCSFRSHHCEDRPCQRGRGDIHESTEQPVRT